MTAQSSTENKQISQNSDTYDGKIDAFDIEGIAQNSHNSLKIEGKTPKSDIDSASEAEKAEESSNFSSISTKEFDNSTSDAKIQNSDTSKNIVDPLSEFESQNSEDISTPHNAVMDEELVFSKLFPNVSLEKLQQDELFCLFCGHNGKNLTISDLYTNYLQLTSALSEVFARKALVSVQNKLSSPGSLASEEVSSEIFFTKEQVLRMSPKEISNNYYNIRKSQQRW